MNKFLLLFLLAIPSAFSQTTVPEWRHQKNLPVALTGHKSVMLHTGDVLIAGGLDASRQATNSSYLYSWRTGEIAPTLNLLKTPRAHHVLIEVAVGSVSRVFAIGGYSGGNGNYTSVASVEMLEYDEAQNNWSWRAIGNLSSGRGDCTAAFDGESFIVVSGGITQTGGVLKSGNPVAMTERINVNTLAIEKIGDMVTPRSEHAVLKILNAQNKPQVITAGGESSKPVTSTEILTGTAWNPQANPPLSYRSAAISFGDIGGIGRVFGGFKDDGTVINTGEWYDVKSGWRTAPRMESARARTSATLIAGVKDTVSSYLIVAGKGTASSLKATEIFDLPNSSSANGAWTTFLPLNDAGFERTVVMTGANLPFVAGGENESGILSGTEIFQPLRANDLTFKAEEAGRTSDSQDVFIMNEWLLPVKVKNFRISGSAEFIIDKTLDSVNISANGGHRVSVRFRPSSPGNKLGFLLFDVGPITDTVMLSGVGLQSSIAVMTQDVKFDSVLVRTSKEICFPAFKNNGSDTTTIDSLVISPKGGYRVISPIGRVAVAPDSVLQICIEFLPEARGAFPAGVNIHLASRVFPISLSGFGIRKFVTANAPTACDTINITPGTTYPAMITVQNPSDRNVTVTAANFNASSPNIFKITNPSELPFTLQPGSFKNVEISFTPERENTERAEVEFVNDGDTISKALVCFVVRSRFVSYSVSEINFGDVCVGDSLSQTVILENPGQFETVEIDSVAITQTAQEYSLKDPIAGVLKPREYTSVTVNFVPTASGQMTAILKTFGSFGSVEIPIRANVLPTLRFSPRDAVAKVGDMTQIVVELSGADPAMPFKERSLIFTYNKTMLWPRQLVDAPGTTGLYKTGSTIRIITPGIAELKPVWVNRAENGDAFAIECDVLRGESSETALTLSGAPMDNYCIPTDTKQFTMQELCGGHSAFVRSDDVVMLQVSSEQDDEHEITLIAPQNGEVTLELVNSLGITIAKEQKGFKTAGLFKTTSFTNDFSNGLYFYRASIDGVPVAFEKVIIIR